MGRLGRAIDPYVRILASVFERRPPLDVVGPTLPGVFAAPGHGGRRQLRGAPRVDGRAHPRVPAEHVLFFLSSSADSVREAERSKALAVTSVGEIQQAARDIARRSRKVFGPRLVVLRVASPVWQDAVSGAGLGFVAAADRHLGADRESRPRLAGCRQGAGLALVVATHRHLGADGDVLWELEELTKRFGDRCVVIGHHERVAALAALPSGDRGPAPVERRLADLLDGQRCWPTPRTRKG